VIALLVVFGMVVWGAATLVIDTWQRGRHCRPSLSDRLAPQQPSSIADEARRWLDQQA
jgi:hypothetical protein